MDIKNSTVVWQGPSEQREFVPFNIIFRHVEYSTCSTCWMTIRRWIQPVPKPSQSYAKCHFFQDKDRILKAGCWQKEMLYKGSNMLIFPDVGILYRPKEKQWHIHSWGTTSSPADFFRKTVSDSFRNLEQKWYRSSFWYLPKTEFILKTNPPPHPPSRIW